MDSYMVISSEEATARRRLPEEAVDSKGDSVDGVCTELTWRSAPPGIFPLYCCYVEGLSWATTEHKLERYFGGFGEIIKTEIIKNSFGRSRGFGFIAFKNEHSMKVAIQRMNDEILDDKNITVYEAKLRRSGGDGGDCRETNGYEDGSESSDSGNP